MMWTDLFIWLETQPQEIKALTYIGIFIGLPLLCVILWFADKKWEEHKEKKAKKK